MKPLPEDISTLSFPPGALRPMTESRHNYVSLLQKGLDNLGVAFPNPGTANVTDIVNTVTDISTFANAAVDTLFVKDPYRGGQFFLYIGADSADNGMIFTDADGNKWKRVITEGRINAQWFGFGEATSASDNYTAITAARDYIYNNPLNTILYIPSVATGYNISTSVLFNQQIKIIGDGTPGYPATKLIFPANTTGLVFEGGTFGAGIENIRIAADISSGGLDVTKHAITTRVVTKIYNVVIDHYPGNGLHISACGSPPSGDNNNFGNADLSHIEYFEAHFCTNGVFLEGCDANSINFVNLNISQCRRWGVFDNGFLGNLYIKPHFAFCGTPVIAGANSVVSYGGKYYAALPGYDDYWGDSGSNINKQPDISPLYWYEVSGMSSLVWDNSTRYYSGGPLCIKNANAWTNIVHSYTEGFQPPILLNSRSKVDGGDNAAGVSGIWHNIVFGTQYINGGDLILPNSTTQRHFVVGEGAPDYSGVIKAYNDFAITSATLGFISENSGLWSLNKLINSSAEVVYGIYNSDYFVSISSGAGFGVNSIGFTPTANNTLDLGTAALKWKTVNAVNATLSGIQEFADNAAALAGGLVAGNVYRTGEFLKIVL